MAREAADVSLLPERHPADAEAFAKGAQAAVAGDLISTNPHTLDEAKNAWNRGWEAATAPGAWAADTAYTLGQMATNGGNIYSCVVAGTSDSSGGPAGTAPRIVDNEVTWQYQGAGSQVDLSCVGYPQAGPPYVPVWA